MNMSHIVKATELKLFAEFHDDWSKQSVSNTTSPNYANYEVTHALTPTSSVDRNILDKLWPKVCLLLIQVAQDSQEDQEGELNFAPSVVVEVCPLRTA